MANDMTDATSPDDDIAGLLPAYALNALPPEDALAVERALERDPGRREALAQYLEGAAALHEAHPIASPSSDVRERLMRRIRGPRQAAQPRPAPRVPFSVLGVAAALAVAVVGLSVFSAAQRQQVADLRNEVQVVTAEAETARSELDEVSDFVAEGAVTSRLDPVDAALAETVSAGATAPSQEPGALDPHAADPHGSERDARAHSAYFRPRGAIVTGPGGESLLITKGLPPLEPGHAYVAWWWDANRHAKSAAVFTVDEGGYARIRLRGDVTRMRGLTVTIEGENGREAPGLDRVLAAEFALQEALAAGH